MTKKKAPAAAPAPRPMGDRNQGRKAYAPDAKRRPRSVNLTDDQWSKYRDLGTDWLIERLAHPYVIHDRAPLTFDAPRKPRSIALTDAQWLRYKELGTDWLIERLNRAKVPAAA